MNQKEVITMDCEVVCDLLPLYHDGVVREETKLAIEQHLKACPSCQKEYDSLCLDFLNDVFVDIYPENRYEKMLKKQKRKKVTQYILLSGLVIMIFGVWSSHVFTQRYSGSKAMQYYILEEFYDNGIDRYTGKILAKKTENGNTIELAEDVNITFENGKYRPWNDTMPETDIYGRSLSRKRWYSVIDCKIETIRYILKNGEKVPDSETVKTMIYKAYDDRDRNSVARSVIDFDSVKVTYSDDESYFRDLEAQMKQ